MSLLKKNLYTQVFLTHWTNTAGNSAETSVFQELFGGTVEPLNHFLLIVTLPLPRLS